MNTNDFQPFEYHDHSLQEVFEKQKIIFDQYMEQEPNKIEDFDVNCYEDQQIFKDFLFRFVEELTEATVDMDHKDHFYEELTDAFNFLVEIYLIYEWAPEDLPEWKDDQVTPFIAWPNGTGAKINYKHVLKSFFYDAVEQAGYVSNLLKNRPWKQCQYLVDLYVFEPRLKKLWARFNILCNACGLSFKNLYELWSLKYQVNKFRLETNY